MIPISDELNESLSADSQLVRPNVKAWMSDLRSLDNLKVHSSNHTYEKQILDRNPQLYVKFDKTDYGSSKKVRECLINNLGTSAAIQVQLNNHGFSNGDEIAFSTDLARGLPTNVKSGELHYHNRYYVEVAFPSYFYIHTSRASAIAKTVGGRVLGGALTSSFYSTISSLIFGANTTFTTTTDHGYSDGDAIVFQTFGTMPTGVSQKDNDVFPVYYIQNSTSNTFNLNTSRFNAIAGLSTGLVEATDAGSGTFLVYPIHTGSTNFEGGHRMKDYGSQAFDIAIGTSDASTPIYDETATSYHDTFENHIEILEPNRLIDTFDKFSYSGFRYSTVTAGSPATFTTQFPVSAGTPIMLSDIQFLTGINDSTVYYAQDPSGTTIKLNTSYYNAINNSATGRISTSGSSETVGVYTLDTPSPGFFTKNGSFDATDSDMSYYSWTANDPKWTCFGNKLRYLDGVVNDNEYYVSTPINALDHFVDFKVDSGKGRNIYTRFIDEDNCVVLSYASPSFAYPIQINAYIDGNVTPVASIDGGVLASFDTTHYYRFEARYNLYFLYDMGTSEPTNTTSGTLKGVGYFDHPKLRTEEAKRCGIGFGNQVSLNPSANLFSLNCEYDYFAAYGYNSLSNLYYFNYDNATSAEKKYLYSSTALSSAKSSQFEALNNAEDFTYSFYFYKQSVPNDRSTIFWLGNSARETALRISYQENVEEDDDLVVTMCSPTTTYVLNTFPNGLGNNNIYHAAVIKNGTRLSIYINGVEVAFRNDIPANFALKDVVTGKTPYMMFGGDYAGTTLGDLAGYHLLANTYLSEFAMFDYALTQSDLNAMYHSINNSAVLASETVDDYCNAECIIDGKLEETFTYAFTNMLSNRGSEIMANNSCYSVSPLDYLSNKTNIEENYGWMSRVQSDDLGLFGLKPDFIELAFDVAKCNKIFISTGYLSGRVSTFNYIITKSDLTTISGGKAFSAESYVYISSSDLGLSEGEYLDIVSVKIIPTATTNPYDYARLFSVNPIWEVDLSEYVISFTVDKIRDNYDASLPIGATAANSGNLILDNTDKLFNIFGNTLYGKYTTPDVPFFFSFDHELAKYGTSEEILLATEMYADTWTFSNSSMTAEVTLRDYSKYLQEKTVDSYVNQGITAGRAISDLMLSSGFPRRKINFIDKYDEVIFLDKPKAYVPFNDTYEQIIDSLENSVIHIFDHCQYLDFRAVPDNLTLGKSLLYSDSLSVQDESERKIIANIESTFEPYYRQGSMTESFFNLGSENIIGNSTNSWTTEIFHFVDLDNFNQLDTEIMLMKNVNTGFTERYNYKLSYEVSGSEITYSWGFLNTSNVEQKITASPVDASIPHQIVVRKTGGSPNVFDLIIDGVVSATLSTSVAINTANCIYFYISPYRAESSTKTFVSNFSFYDYALPDQNIYNHFVSSSVALISTYRYLYAADETYWDAMLSIATADIGMFYIDEYGIFRYEFRNFIHEDIFDKHQNSQYTFSDDVNIIEGNYVTEVQTNKISVAVKKVSVESTSTSGLWSASDGESLITGTLSSSISPESTGVTLTSATDPYWFNSGYIKIDDEIIRYNDISGNVLGKLERGYFGTAVSWHAAGSLVREVKYFNIVYSSKPAAAVKYPLLTNNFVDVDRFSATSGSAEIIVSVSEGAPKNATYLLSGTNALTSIKDGFSLAGVAVSNSENEELVTDMASEITSNLRRYGVKELKIDNPFIQNKDYAKLIADYVLGYYKEPVRILDIQTLAVPNLQLGDLITISKFEDLGIVNKKYWIVSISMSYDGGITQNLSLRAYGDTIQRPGFTFGSTAVEYTPPGGGGGDREYFPQS